MPREYTFTKLVIESNHYTSKAPYAPGDLGNTVFDLEQEVSNTYEELDAFLIKVDGLDKCTAVRVRGLSNVGCPNCGVATLVDDKGIFCPHCDSRFRIVPRVCFDLEFCGRALAPAKLSILDV